MTEVDILIKGAKVLTVDKAENYYEDGFVAIKDNKIIDLGPTDKNTYTAKETIDGYNKLCMPGLVNTHTHAGMTLYRGAADDLPLMTWLNDHIWPLEANFGTGNSVKTGTELALVEMLRSGTTTFCDMYFFAEIVGDVAKDFGMRAVIGEGLIDFATPSMKTPDEGLKHMSLLAEKWKEEPLLSAAFSPHAPYSCNKSIIEEAKKRADEANALFHIHLSESKGEIEKFNAEYGKSPVQYMDDLGVLDKNSLAAHCVHLSNEDMSIILKRDMAVSHNPQSNMKISSGIAPIDKLIKMGVRVGIATDGAASNNKLNMFEEMNFASKLQKVSTYDATALDAKTTVSMGTKIGADILKLGKTCGSLEVGKDADMILIDLDKPQLTPFYDPYSHIIYSMNGSEVDTVIIRGKVIMEKGIFKTIDEKEILYKARKIEKEIRSFQASRK